jgi:hypothetical protein
MKPDSNVDQPTGWPRPATPSNLKPRWAGEFASHADWVNKATVRLTGATGSVGQDVPPICVDAQGRRCHVGKDFARARDEDAFPVRYFWECQPDDELPDDVRRLVIAARVVAFEDQSREALKELDEAVEAFSTRVPWADQPEDEE